MPLLGVDVGTTGCKCTLFDDEENVIGYAYKEYFFEEYSDGRQELDARKVWESVKFVIHEAVKGRYLSNTAIAVSSIGEACVPVDSNGKVLCNSIMYTDIRGVGESEYLKKRLGSSRIMEITGLSAHSMYTVCKIMWMKEHMPDVYSRVWRFLLIGDFIAYRLSGQPVIDYSLASRTMAFDVIKKEWSNEILEAAGLCDAKFSDLEAAGSIIGTVKKEVAIELRLPLSTIVVTGGHDQACAALGAGITTEKSAVYGMGTAHCITTALKKPNMGMEMLEQNYNCEPHLIDGMYISLAFCFSGGALLKWYRDCFAAAEVKAAEKIGMGVYDYLEQTAAKEPTDLLVLPYFSGAGTPYMNPYSKGAILGLTLDTTAAQFYRALLEGVAYEMRFNMECQEKAGIRIDSLRAVGGGTKSNLWPQIAADIMGKKIECLNIEESGTVATAMLAGRGLGIYGSWDEALQKFVKIKKTYISNAISHAEYNKHFEMYKKVYDATKKIFN